MQNSKLIFEQLSIHYRATHKEAPETIKTSADLMASDLPTGLTETEIKKAFVAHRQRVKTPPSASDIIKAVQSAKITTTPIQAPEIKFLPMSNPNDSLIYQRSFGKIKGPVLENEKREAIGAMTELVREHSGELRDKYNDYLTYMMAKGEYHPEIIECWGSGFISKVMNVR